MAESETECAHEVKIPQAHKFGSLLSGNIVLLTCDQMTDPHRHKLWSIDTKGMQPLEVRCQGFLETVHVLENGNQIILAFRANDGNRGPTSAGIFIIDSTKFTVERVPSTP